MPTLTAVNRIYSVPRRYDLATMFTICLAYAVLFGGMQGLEFPPLAFALLAGFFTLVGAAQAILFRGTAPRAASVIASTAIGIVTLVSMGIANRSVIPLFLAVTFTVWTLFVSVLLGYIAGVLIGGVFLVAEIMRQLARRLLRG